MKSGPLLAASIGTGPAGARAAGPPNEDLSAPRDGHTGNPLTGGNAMGLFRGLQVLGYAGDGPMGARNSANLPDTEETPCFNGRHLKTANIAYDAQGRSQATAFRFTGSSFPKSRSRPQGTGAKGRGAGENPRHACEGRTRHGELT